MQGEKFRRHSPSMRPQRECCQPRLGVAELVCAQSVRVDTLSDAQIVAEQLTDNGAWDGQHQFVHLRHDNHRISIVGELVVAFYDDSDGRRTRHFRSPNASVQTLVTRSRRGEDESRPVGCKE